MISQSRSLSLIQYYSVEGSAYFLIFIPLCIVKGENTVKTQLLKELKSLIQLVLVSFPEIEALVLLKLV